MEFPLSIVIPTHNRPHLLPRAVASALANCPPEGEVLVADDRSVPPASETLLGFCDGRLRIVASTEPPGASGTRNAGAAAARGQYLFFLDDDDEMLPGYCARVTASAIRPGHARAGYSALEHVGLDGRTAIYGRRRLRKGVIPASASMRKRIAGLGTGFWIERALYRELGGLDPSLRTDEDTDLTLRLAARGIALWYEPEPGTRQHAHETGGNGGQLTRRSGHRERADACLQTYRLNAVRFPPFHKARWFLLARYIAHALKAGEAHGALRVAASARPITLVPKAMLFLGAKYCIRRLKRGRLASS